MMTATVDILNSTSQLAVCNRIIESRSYDEHLIGNFANDAVEHDEHRFDKNKFEKKVTSSWKGDRIPMEIGRAYRLD